MRFTGINHLAMATGDMDRTIRYWRDLLGLRLVAAQASPDGAGVPERVTFSRAA